jgi:uncharacterized membrane protein YeaQ/YmgE (transglycosylase-associated protein family)
MLPSILLAAFIGGMLHAALGIRKYNLKRGQLAAIISDGIIGAVAGVAALSLISLSGNSALLFAGLSGYVGADLVNSLIKIKAKRTGGIL